MGKPSSADTPNQNNYYDDQDFDIDIDKTYADWIGPIDSIRSFSSIQGSTEIIKNLPKDANITEISKLVNMENSVQESRCHAFFRMIGFPVVSGSSPPQIYNPGFDIIKDATRTIKNKDKLSIAKNPIKDFDALSDAREKQSQDNLSTFSVSTSIDAGVLALSSGGTEKLRSFIAPLEKDPDALGVGVKDQSYSVNIISRVGQKNKSVPLTDFQDRGGNKPEENSNLVNRSHIIKPFIVDARIDLTIAPQSRLMVVPFIPNNDPSFLKLSGVESVSPTVLEKIITERVSPQNSDSAGTNIKAIEEYIKTIPAVKDADLLSTVTSKDVYKQANSSKFINSVNTIRTMMTKLVGAENLIRIAQENYYWVPAPSASGPEGGLEIQDVFLPTFIDTKLQTAADQEIIVAGIRLALSGNLNTEASAPRSIVPTTDFGNATGTGLGSNDSKNSETLLQTRERVLRVAGEALRTVEIIMGEFSGLGLCDIVAIISALNIMTTKSLLGFLDDDAYARMQKSLKVDKPERADFTAAAAELTSIVKDYYNLMDKIYKDIKERQGIV